MSLIPIDVLRELWPHGDRSVPGLMESVSAGDRWFEEYGVVSRVQRVHFMAQVSHERGAGLEMVENLNYSEEALLRQWPRHFTPEQAREMARRPRLIANQAYNGRMGNRLGSDDGWDYRGRGGTQVTGRNGYEGLSSSTGLDLINHPELVNEPEHFLRCALGDFIQCGCLRYATPTRDYPVGDISMVTRMLNGDHIGMDQRRAWFQRWWPRLS